MDTLVWLSGICFGLSYLTFQYDRLPIFERSHETVILTLAVTGLCTLTLCFIFPKLFDKDTQRGGRIQLPSFDRANDPGFQGRSSNGATGVLRYAARTSSVDTVMLVVAICARFELFRRVLAHTACSSGTFETWLPLLLIFFDRSILRPRRRRRSDLNSEQRLQSPPLTDAKGSLRTLLLSLFTLCLSAALVLKNASPPKSSYICALSLPWHLAVPLYQVAGCLCDAQIILSAFRILCRGREEKSSRVRIATVGGCLLVASVVLLVISMIFYASGNQHFWARLMGTPGVHPFSFAFVTAFTFLCILKLFMRTGITPIIVATLFTILTVTTAKAGLTYRGIFPLLPSTAVLSFLAAAYMCMVYVLAATMDGYSNATTTTGKRSSRGLKRFAALAAVAFTLESIIWFSRPGPHGLVHPIHSLIARADEQHAQWKNGATSSSTLQEAVQVYRERYGRDPPARFNRWYNYAQLQDSLIIDRFDAMYDDLLPFWSLPPAEIRERTSELINSKNNFIGGVFIRKGGVAIGGNFPDTHRWMLESTARMISPYAKWLPDMDLAFNLNDAPRVAVPNDEIKKLREEGEKTKPDSPSIVNRDFERSREKDWKALFGNPLEGTMADATFENTFDDFGSVGCPADAEARTSPHWDTGMLCDSCADKHSTLHFVSNWTLAGDPCHQPDLANLHGFYISPAMFKATYNLMPVFSQSKVAGFNDIIYPSVWNYRSKVVYEPDDHWPDVDFAQKQPTLFWRGSASDGASANSGAWQGMLRQRAVHLLTNASESTRSVVLLPTDGSDNEADDTNDNFSLRSFCPTDLHKHLSASVRFASQFQRCFGKDCDDQEAEFSALNTPYIAFQEHWKYKYLLDLDGAGFSGRLLPFLLSRSLVFRAGLMRAWWDDRLVAWKHFVPIDVRLREVWSVLAYFAGWRDDGRSVRDTSRDGKKVRWLMAPHEDDAKAIANAGREWAARVLRREDMEVYMFRLLLEWARLTDDKRAEVNYN